MKLLSKKEVEIQDEDKNFKIEIARICQAYVMGMADLVKGEGYKNKYKNRAEITAYDYGWNSSSKILSNKS